MLGFSTLMARLANAEIEGAPPGGGELFVMRPRTSELALFGNLGLLKNLAMLLLQ